MFKPKLVLVTTLLPHLKVLPMDEKVNMSGLKHLLC